MSNKMSRSVCRRSGPPLTRRSGPLDWICWYQQSLKPSVSWVRFLLGRLAASIRDTWGTEAISDDLVAQAVQHARAARLLAVEQQLGGSDTYRLTPDAQAQSSLDQEWARKIVGDFSREFRVRLETAPEGAEIGDRLPRLRDTLLKSLIAGTERAHDVAFNLASPDRLVPLRFDIRAIADHIRHEVQPRSVAIALVHVAAGAADPDDAFGNEIIHLLLTGSILHGVITGGGQPSGDVVQGMRIALDTSALVYAIDRTIPTKDLFERLVQDSVALGVEVVVADHTIAEWDRLWDGAASEIKGRPSGDIDLAAHHPMLLRNPVSQGFASARAQDSGLTWQRFEVSHRDIATLVASLGAQVRPAGNHTSTDLDLEGSILEEMMAQVERGKLSRTQNSAHADAASCAMVARWRNAVQADPACAWFIANDTGTAKAYRKLRPDDAYWLSISPESWLLFLASVRSDSSNLADDVVALARVVTHRSVYAIASGYSVEETVELARMLGDEDDSLTPSEMRGAIQLDFQRLLFESPTLVEDDPERLLRVGAELLARRARQRDQRAANAEALAIQREREAAETMAAATAKEQELTRKLEEANAKATAAQQRADQVSVLSPRPLAYYSTLLGLLGVLAIAFLLRLRASGLLALGLLGIILVALHSRPYVTDPDIMVGSLLRDAAIQVVGAVMLLILDAVVS